LYDNASVWEVRVVSTPENDALKLGDFVFSNQRTL